MKILLAEDNPMWLKVLETNTTAWGFQPVLATDGQEAIEEMGSQDAPRIAVLDWQMPETDGVEVCRRIKGDADRPYTYVVLLTCRDSKEDIVAGLDAGADDYLTKPVDLDVLKLRLNAARRIVEAIPPKGWSRPRVDGYEVKQVLGRGAFATVWEAVHVASGLPRALKILRVDLATEKVFERFAREIEVMKELDHPYLAKIYDSRIDNTIGYYSMDLIRGGTLYQYIREHQSSAVEIIRMVAQVCEGLQHAHDRGIVHRDMKLSNVMVTEEGVPKVVDFGLGKSMFVAPQEDPNQTLDGSVIGTPLFMSPEQARGEVHRIDQRSDIYSTAIILYLLLLKKHPHDISPQDRQQTIHAIASGPVCPPSEVKQNFNPELEKIVLKALHPSLEHRYQRADAFATDLYDFIQRRTKRGGKPANGESRDSGKPT
ncbi:protein kinase domain-containing protein [Novipirellula artificiosorum]|uniref:Serine/threonine-protein kinase PknB n=1 Tax=Novipirellula artificiosorum TaxID=2528016 RepID=A0A5C6E0H6_9BACT|nr:protein kinase [Novipirellula artificiosorum]TWU42392.1 Serine/threonine-protein kinase PknB [Novipirellula artificiosorum]